MEFMYLLRQFRGSSGKSAFGGYSETLRFYLLFRYLNQSESTGLQEDIPRSNPIPSTNRYSSSLHFAHQYPGTKRLNQLGMVKQVREAMEQANQKVYGRSALINQSLPISI
jgi:hypothetical protein